MSKKKQDKRKSAPVAPRAVAAEPAEPGFPLWWLLGLLVLTGLLFWPMLGNQFTNWDDELYVVNNALLRGPDWKGIFTEPVVSNYHPLTILTLALNYQVSELQPFSYFLVNWALHLANTALVFVLAWRLSGEIRWVAVFTALVFAIHPMHVESVAWISERKDVLYAFFYLLALLRYWRYLTHGQQSDYWTTMGLFVLALLAKPAAVVLPLTLLLLDYWKGRTWERRVWLEKVPFLALSAVVGVATVLIQSKKAIASLDLYSVTDRLFFGCYGLTTYVARFFAPVSLSPFHAYPPVDNLGLAVQTAPLVLLALAGVVWYFRTNKVLVFGALFYVANIILVVQFLSIGNTILGERYTYLPYVGLAFALAMLIAEKAPEAVAKPLQWALLAVAVVGLGWATRQYLRVWENTESLWTGAIQHYPGAPVPRSNRANFYYQQALRPENAARYQELMEKAGADCDAALQSNPNHFASLDIRALTHIRLGTVEQAVPLAQRMTEVEPGNPKGFVLLGTALQRLKRYDEALETFSQALDRNPNDADALNGRGTAFFNGKQRYAEALADFDRAIAIEPKGETYLNRSRCYLMLGDKAKARENAEQARALGSVVQADYWNLLQ